MDNISPLLPFQSKVNLKFIHTSHHRNSPHPLHTAIFSFSLTETISHLMKAVKQFSNHAFVNLAYSWDMSHIVYSCICV